MKDNKKIWLGILLVFLIGLFFILPAVQAATSVTLPTGTGLSEKTVYEILDNFLKWLLGVAGIIALIGFVISGIMYLVSTGNDEMITKAKKYMMYCLIGVVVIVSSFVVIQAIDAILNASGSY